MPDAAIELRSLSKAFGDRVVVDALDMRIAPGEVLALLGPNGAGKTTTISMLCGLVRPDRGDVLIGGRPASPRLRRHIGLVPQEIALWEGLTARENLEFFGRLHGLRRQELAAGVRDALEIVALSDRSDEHVRTFSGGMKRRANIAAALVHRPRLLVMDEPTVGIDPQSRNYILERVRALADGGTAVLFASHYLDEVDRLADRVAILDAGVLRFVGAPDELRTAVGQSGHGVVVRFSAADAVRARCEVEAPALVECFVDEDLVLRGSAVDRLADVVRIAAAAGSAIIGVEPAEERFEQAFLAMTGSALRD